MKMNALWWWIDRWRKSTAYTDMTLEEQGAYRNLLDEATLRGGSLPVDERILAKASGDAPSWRRVRGAVMARFELVEGVYRNETLDSVLQQSRRRATNQANYRGRRRNGHGGDNQTSLAPDNAPDNTGANKPDYPDPDLSVQPPIPPSVEGGRLTRAERASAEADLAEFRDGQPRYVAPVHREPGRVYQEPRSCPHDPECADLEVCLALFAVARRKRVQQALATGAAS